jgi:hypothetical protein
VMDRVADILGLIVLVALATTLVLPGRQTASVVKAFGGAFSSSITAAMGQR